MLQFATSARNIRFLVIPLKKWRSLELIFVSTNGPRRTGLAVSNYVTEAEQKKVKILAPPSFRSILTSVDVIPFKYCVIKGERLHHYIGRLFHLERNTV